MDPPTTLQMNREVLTEEEVSITEEVVLAFEETELLPGGSVKDIVRQSLQWPGCELGASVHVSMARSSAGGKGAAGYFFLVDVEGVPEASDVWITGQFMYRPRCTHEDGVEPCNAPATWLRGDGRLAFFPALSTLEFSGTVMVFGPAAAASPSSATASAADFSALRPLGDLCDVVLRAAGRDFPAHRNVLAVRSPVFLAMFTGDFKEARDKVVDITVECSAEVFAAFVDFFYSGVLEKRSSGDLLHLLELGERHLVPDLKHKCEQHLLHVGVDEALELLRASLEKAFVPKECREHALRVIRANWQSVSTSEEWPKFRAAQPAVGLVLEGMMTIV